MRSCINACVECAEACEKCASACLAEVDVAEMVNCIRLDRDCAAICWMAASFISRQSESMHELCRVCAEICEACGLECAKHKDPHCQDCAMACQKCAAECRQVAEVIV